VEELLLALPLLRAKRPERTFGRLKDFRRIATRHDRLARNFLGATVVGSFEI
jgi:transposase